MRTLTIEDIAAYAKECFVTARGSHDWDHTERVHRLCMHIGQTEGADLEVLAVAAYLHDVGRSYEDESKGTICHAEKGAEIAKTVLVNFPLSHEKKWNMVHCIGSHRFRVNHAPETDKLEIRISKPETNSKHQCEFINVQTKTL